ncbi:MAG: hypothetical protein Fur0012_14190 [Elusimicrobiota bacterium]
MAETIGSLVDKITIAELKIFHMSEQLNRQDASQKHKERAAEKLEILKVQSHDLQQELSELFMKVARGEVRLKIYRQFKMYNDPAYRIK